MIELLELEIFSFSRTLDTLEKLPAEMNQIFPSYTPVCNPHMPLHDQVSMPEYRLASYVSKKSFKAYGL